MHNTGKDNKKAVPKPELILLFTAAAGSILYISLIFNDNLWVDEAFTAALIRGSMAEVIRDTVNDTLPPFYNVAGKLLTAVFGFSPLVLKLFSCIPMILLMFFGGRKLFSVCGFRTAFLYELFLIAMPHFLHYGVEIRMYSWGVFACGMAGTCFLNILKDDASLIPLSLFTVFAGYIHHFALVSCGMLWLMLLLIMLVKRDIRELKKYGLNLLLIFLLYLPGLLLTVFQIKNASSYFSMAPLSFNSLLSDIRFPFVTNITLLSALLLVSCFAAVVFCLLPRIKAENAFEGLCLLSVIFLTLFFGYGVSLLAGRSLFTARYLVPSLALLWMGIACFTDAAVSALDNNRFLMLFAAVIIVLTGEQDYRQAFREEYVRGAEIMEAYFRDNISVGDRYIIHEDVPEIEICLKYYCPALKKTGWKKAAETAGNLWLFDRGDSKKPLEKAAEYGYNPKYISDFCFDRYSFSLYKLEKEEN